MSFFTYKHKLSATVLFYDEEILRQRSLFSQRDEVCRLVPDTIFFQPAKQLNVNFGFANVTFTKKRVFLCVCAVFMSPLITKVTMHLVLVKRSITNDVLSF
jgi:hypothetical protein